MKYKYGTILKFTPKAIKKHPNHYNEDDRLIVVDKAECIWYSTKPMFNTYTKPIVEIPAFSIFMFDMYKEFDSFVQVANEELPQLYFYKKGYSGGYIQKEKFEKYIKDFNINMMDQIEQMLLLK